MVRPGSTRLSLNNLLLQHDLPVNAVRDKAVYEKNERFWADRPLTEGLLETLLPRTTCSWYPTLP